ncbi:MAG: hypothetical protein ACXVI9_14005 [Mucilaginibacter sp.]
MKYLVPVFLIFSIAFFGCKKDVPLSAALTGTWELSLNVDGMTGHVTHHKPGNDTLMTFTADGKYSVYDHNKLTRSGIYTVKKDTYSMDHTIKNRIIFDNAYDNTHEFFDISNNQLTLYLDAYDAPGVGYRRVK